MNLLNKIILAFSLAVLPVAATAQDANPAQAAQEGANEVVAASGEAENATAAGEYTPMDATTAAVVGKPVDGGMDFQEQYTENGKYAKWLNNVILLPVITFISLFVLFLLFYVMVRFRRSANPVPSKTTHNSFIEIVWIAIPILILFVIAYPSLDLLAKQFKPAPENAVTVKATGYQWYWTYTYPDHGDFEIVSNMLQEKDVVEEGKRFRTDADGPEQLAVDNRMVVPAGVPIRMQTTAADVIHSFAVPALWFKLDSVPGRLNEKTLTITEPGLYFGQCSELCGARHGFMPITVEALPPAEFAVWVKSQGGTMPSDAKAEAPTEDVPAEDAKADETDNNNKTDAADAAAAN